MSDQKSPINNASASPWQVPLLCLGLIALVFSIYAQTLWHGFINFDDPLYVTENPVIQKGITWEGMKYAATTVCDENWHPLTMLTHMADCQFYGTWAGGHHLTCLMLHALGVVLLFLLLRSMTGALWKSALVAALWAVHPLRVESVAWIAELKDVLSGDFFFMTLIVYVSYTRRRTLPRYLAVMLLFALGLMSKPMLVTLPFVLLLLDYWPLHRMERLKPQTSLLPLLLEKIPLLVLAFLSVITTLWAQKGAIEAMNPMPLSLRLGNAVMAYGTYLFQMVWPVNLAIYYPVGVGELSHWKIVSVLILLVAISLLVIAARKRLPYLLVGWFWYLGMLLPVIGILKVGSQAYADRYTYLPTIGILIALVWGAEEGTKGARWRGRKQNTPVALGVILSATLAILATLTALSWRQTSLWADNENLWRHTISVTTENALADYQLAGTLIERNHLQEAIPILKEALRIVPKDPEVLYSLANLYYRRGQFEEALNDYRLSLRYGNKAEAHCNLGSTLYHLGRREEASDEYREAIKARPGYVNAHYNLGRVLIELGSGGEGVDELRKALKLNPSSSKARHELGKFLYQQGQRKEGIEEMNGAVDLDPSSTAIKNDLAWMLATAPESSLRNGPRSLELAIRAENENPGPSPMILRTLAAAFAEIGDYPKAREAAGLALKLSKASSDAALADDLSRKIILLESEKPLRDP